MRKAEYLDVLRPIVAEYRSKPYAFWRRQMPDSPIVMEVEAIDGTQCCVEIGIWWDSLPDSDIRVGFAIDDGGWRALAPVTEDFIITPDGTLLG